MEHASLWVERPVRRIAGSNRLNPLPHAGTISVFLLGVVVVSGLYITLFFEFGYDASYDSVASMESHAIQRVVRALHRYSSAAMVLTTVVHAWRIFAAGRFGSRPRRRRWASGLAALLLVWLAGVTGYWLVWDVRAQAISEATIALIRDTGWGADLAVHQLSGIGPGSGSAFLLVMWFLHLGLTAAIGWFTFRHLRRSKMPWLPPRHWMLLMGGSLTFVSLALPVGMLGPADPDRLVPNMPVDPFVLFLLPPLLAGTPWLAVAIGASLLMLGFFLPRILRRSDPLPIAIIDEACTGCELCVIDCPYDALSLSEQRKGPPLAVVDESACVACGICVGSCAFGAIELPGTSTQPMASVSGRTVLVVCDRHLSQSKLTEQEAVVVPVRCAGAFSAPGVRAFMEEGASGVQLIGCPPNDCRYGVGNQLASERLRGSRAPHSPRRWVGKLTEDWVPPTELNRAVSEPGGHPSATGSAAPPGREALVGAGVLVALSVLAIAFATRAPFRGGSDQSQLRVAVDHRAGLELRGVAGASPASIDAIEAFANGNSMGRKDVAGNEQQSIGLLDWPMTPGPAEIEIAAISGDITTIVFSQDSSLSPGERLVVDVGDIPPPPGAREGEKVFNARAAGCAVCHSADPGDDGVGPSLAGVASVAGDRVAGLSAELYLRQSILLPDQYVVDGWPAGQMLPIYRDRLSDEELDALITYLLTLEGDGGP